MNTRPSLLAALVAGLIASYAVDAAELESVEVEREDGLYTLKSVSVFDTDRESLYAVLIDYDEYVKFTSAMAESRNMEPDERGRPEFYTRMEGCVLVWCQSFVRIGYLDLDPHRYIAAYSDPERSDFKRSNETWVLEEVDGGTRLIYEFEMIPDFWVPPVIGPIFIKRALRSGGSKAVDRIEQLAQAVAAANAGDQEFALAEGQVDEQVQPRP